MKMLMQEVESADVFKKCEHDYGVFTPKKKDQEAMVQLLNSG